MTVSPPFFRLATPRDMLEKARRELAKFEAEPSVDHAFNFFVTVFHVRDYARAQGIDVGVMDANPDFELCRLACNQGKHLCLKDKTEKRASERGYSSHGDAAFFGEEEYAIVADDQRISVSPLGRRVLAAWEQVLATTASPPI